MEVTTHSVPYAKFPNPLITCSPTFFHSKLSILSPHSPTFPCFKSLFHVQLQGSKIKARQRRNLGAIHASEAESPSTVDTGRWILEPVGDGDWRHIGFKVPMPGAFEISSSVVTVGRVSEKADLVIPVATVSGLHARIKKKNGSLLVMDLDSTNGTYIDEERLKPGVVATVSSGSCIIFGDTHLAMFRVSKIDNGEVSSKPEKSEIQLESDSSTINSETAS